MLVSLSRNVFDELFKYLIERLNQKIEAKQHSDYVGSERARLAQERMQLEENKRLFDSEQHQERAFLQVTQA